MTHRPAVAAAAAAAAAVVAVLALALAAIAPVTARAQVAPDARWRTLRTAHFAVHYSRGLEEAARRTAANAERAYAELSRELVPPRGTVDVVVADNVDYTNGFATPFPSNRIVVYAHPPVDVQSLRYYDDWSSLVITHELTHIFHLDRTRGWWAAAQHVFGRNPVLFPNTYEPSWVTEGLAVYYESRLTGYGRIAGSEHRMIARAAALGDAVPRLDQLSLATPRFPQGDAAYGYGSLLVTYLARTRGAEGVRRFVDRTAQAPVPFFLDRAARASFGASFTRAWREWRDSLARDTRRAAGAGDTGGAPAPTGWRPLTSAGWYELFPRWVDSSTVAYAANTGRSTAGAYVVRSDGSARPRRVGRRSAVDVNAPRAGQLVYAQLDYTSPYVLRSDLWAQPLAGGPERQLTRGARLSAPDVRASDGAIVAVQAVPATTRLVLLDASGGSRRALTTTSADTQWSEPRWSPDGARIAAVRRSRDGASTIVVLDTVGREVRVAAASRAVDGAPAWSADGATLYFTSDRTGSTQLYSVALGGAESAAAAPPAAPPTAPRRLTDVATGIFYPSVAPDGGRVAAALYRADGYQIGVAPLDGARDFPVDTLAEPAPRDRTSGPEAVERVTTPSRRYAAWRTLVPRYWLPVFGRTDEQRLALGAYTSGSDVVGRHSFAAQLTAPVSGHAEPAAYAAYRYAGLGVPLLDAGVDQSWDHFDVSGPGGVSAGTLIRRTRTYSLAATTFRPRARSYSSLTAGASLEDERYGTLPRPLLEQLSPVFSTPIRYPELFAGASWSNLQYPSLAISPEDGLALSTTVRQRWRQGGGSGSRSESVVGVVRGFKSVDASGYAHSVVAVRLAGAAATAGATDAFEAGGVSGSSLELVPGVVVGSSQRTFGVRGFPVAAIRGVRAFGYSAEYRAPLTMPGRGLGLLPIFLSRTLLTGFVDGASVACPRDIASRTPACLGVGGGTPSRIASAGVELGVDAALQYDTPYRFRLGAATPLTAKELFGTNRLDVYATLGVAF